MPSSYTKIHYDFSTLPWLTSPRRQLHLQGVGLGLIRMPAGEGTTFTHRHRRQEEVYIVIEGEGTMLVDESLIDLIAGDIVRVAATSRRALKAGACDLVVICAGAVPMGYPLNPDSRYLIDDGIPDYDDIPPWYRDREDVAARNQHLKERMLAARRRRRAKGASGEDSGLEAGDQEVSKAKE